jgi:4-phospho-D-threonate 3-dehydrogenase / 4-phospho-D-erythronate 3-dehydrogenase
MSASRIRLAISLGDPNGIGPEVVLKALANASVRDRITPLAVGSPAVLHHYAHRFGLEDVARSIEIVDTASSDALVEEGTVTTGAGRLAMEAVARACDLCTEGAADAMVTAPIHKEAIHRAGYAFPGHTEFLAERTAADGSVMLMVSGALRVALVTTHIPLREVASRVTTGAVLATLTRLHDGLRADFGIPAPRLALLGMNPHAGDGGVLGTEEVDVLEPAVTAARQRGLDVSGPHPADGFFGRKGYLLYDAVLSTYHDQGLVGFKAIAAGQGVNVTLGLPIVRTSPDHGTAFDLAGRGTADAASMIAAIHLAADIAERRKGASRTAANESND